MLTLKNPLGQIWENIFFFLYFINLRKYKYRTWLHFLNLPPDHTILSRTHTHKHTSQPVQSPTARCVDASKQIMPETCYNFTVF